jgi:hypothetical protein
MTRVENVAIINSLGLPRTSTDGKDTFAYLYVHYVEALPRYEVRTEPAVPYFGDTPPSRKERREAEHFLVGHHKFFVHNREPPHAKREAHHRSNILKHRTSFDRLYYQYFILTVMFNAKTSTEWGASRRSSCSDLNGTMRKTHSVDFSRMTIRTSRTDASQVASQFSRRAARGSYSKE